MLPATTKYGVRIITSDPSTGTIEAAAKGGQLIRVSVVTTPVAFRWPVAGEAWMVRQENGTWYLDAPWPGTPAAPVTVQNVNPGDTVLNSPTGTLQVIGSADGASDFAITRYGVDGTQTANLSSAFSQGAWVIFPINQAAQSAVTITVTNTGSANAVLSGIFLGGGAQPPPPLTTQPIQVPQGQWVNTYGAGGYAIGAWNSTSSDLVSMPGVTVTPIYVSRFQWATSTTDVRALESVDGLTRKATTWYNPDYLQIQLTFSAAYAGNLALYAVDWDSSGRRQTVAITPSVPSVVTGGAAGGDLVGTFPNPSVAKLQNRSVSASAPSTGQCLMWDGSSWSPGGGLIDVDVPTSTSIAARPGQFYNVYSGAATVTLPASAPGVMVGVFAGTSPITISTSDGTNIYGPPVLTGVGSSSVQLLTPGQAVVLLAQSGPGVGWCVVSGPAPPVDAVAATASLRTLGTGAQQAAAGNDARIVGAAQQGSTLIGGGLNQGDAIIRQTASGSYFYRDNSSHAQSWSLIDAGGSSFNSAVGAGFFVTLSDDRLKAEVTALDGLRALATVRKLRGVKHSYRTEYGSKKVAADRSRDFGFIAQEVREAAPEVVSAGQMPDGREVMGLDYMRLVPLLTEAIKYLADRVEALEAQIQRSA